MSTPLFTPVPPDSPLGAWERWHLGQSQPEDVGILHKVLFNEQGKLTDPHGCSWRQVDHVWFTEAISKHSGYELKDRERWFKSVFGDRFDYEVELPTDLLALVMVYDAVAGTSHLQDKENVHLADECLWQKQPDWEEIEREDERAERRRLQNKKELAA